MTAPTPTASTPLRRRRAATTIAMRTATKTVMTTAARGQDSESYTHAAPPLVPQFNFAGDPELVDISRLFDPDWLWQTYCSRFEVPDSAPQQIRVRQFSHTPGRRAIASYELEWPESDYLPSEHLAVRVDRGKPAEMSRYPDDIYLPGLGEAADPESAIRLMNTYVFAVPAKRARVEIIRYRPANRAVLRHSVHRVRFYARVVRPDSVPPLLNGHNLIAQSGFVSPRIAGHWADGGVVWLSEMPGRNLRRHIGQGRPLDPEPLLAGLETLWALPHEPQGNRPFNLSGAYERAKRSFRHNLRDHGRALELMNSAVETLDPFVRSWQPTGIAHNDFYDDQMLVLPDGRIALVDFEEAGPGDPLLDVGNFLAHLSWAALFGRPNRAEASREFHRLFRSAAIERYRWSQEDLALREAVCLFRVCTNAIRRPQEDWESRLEAGLTLVNETLGTSQPL